MKGFRSVCRALLIGLVALTLSGLEARAEDPPARSALATLKEKIAAMQQRLLRTGNERDRLADELRAIELETAGIQHNIGAAQSDTAALTRELSALDSRRRQLETAHKAQTERLATEITTAYRLGRQGPIKLLFNLENPQDMSRNLKYYDYFLTARRKKMDRYRLTLAELAGVKASIQHKQAALVEQQQVLLREQQQRRLKQEERQRLIEAMNGELQTEKSRLADLTAESGRLEAVVKAIAARQRQVAEENRRAEESRRAEQNRRAEERRREEQALAKLDAPARSRAASADTAAPRSPAATAPSPGLALSGSFAQQRGKLSWPTQGTVAQRFGAPRAQSLNWQGWLLQAADGAAVRVIFPGQVVFSDYLRGYGLLIIVDHGGGYLSLYGRNRTLLKTTGDRVRAGDTIATVGNTGGAERSALYFEIRHQGRAIDPKPWLRAQG